MKSILFRRFPAGRNKEKQDKSDGKTYLRKNAEKACIGGMLHLRDEAAYEQSGKKSNQEEKRELIATH